MGSDAGGEVVHTLPDPSSVKAHFVMCSELAKLASKASILLPKIEAARPRCSSGIQALCLLNRAIEKAKGLVQYCSESSKFYLVLTADSVLRRCENTRNMLEQSLCQIQNMVPVLLAVEISRFLDDIRSTTFMLDSSEEEAGKIVRELLCQGSPESVSAEQSELKAFQLAAWRLRITSAKAVLIEKRSIKRLLEKTSENERKKKNVAQRIAYLFRLYGKSILSEQSESVCSETEQLENPGTCLQNLAHRKIHEVETQTKFRQNDTERDVTDCALPEEFKCPLSSRLMFDPVVIASGQTYERMWIQRWFDEGNDTCPKTTMKLDNFSLTPNVTMKDFISRWCTRYGVTVLDPSAQPELNSWDHSSSSIASLASSINDLRLQVDLSNVSLGSLDNSFSSETSFQRAASGLTSMSIESNDSFQGHQTNKNANHRNIDLISKLTDLEWESQCKAVRDVKNMLEKPYGDFDSTSNENFLEPVMRFLQDARDKGDKEAQRTGLQLLLAYMQKRRYAQILLSVDSLSVLAFLVNSEVAVEALGVLEKLSAQKRCRPNIAASGALASVITTLDSENKEIQELSLKIIYNLSSSNEIRPYFISLDCIPSLVPSLKDSKFARYALLIIKNLSDVEEVRISVTETSGCIASIVELLETGSNEDQEHAVSILLSLCAQRVQYCQLVMEEGFSVYPALINISVNGSERAKIGAMELVRLLNDANDVDAEECRDPEYDASRDTGNLCREKKSSSKDGFFWKKLNIFSKAKK